MLGLGGPVFALIEAPTRGFGDPLILVALVGGIALLRALPRLGARARRDPMLPLRLFRRRNFTFANLETFTVYAGALDADASSSSLFLQQLAGYSPFQSGLAHGADHGRDVRPLAARRAACRCGSGRASSWASARSSARRRSSGCAALSPGFAYWTALLPPLLVFSVGLSLIVAPLTATVLADAGRGDAGIASGVNNAVARVAGLLGIAVVGAAIAGADNQLDLPGYPHGDGDHGGLVRRRRRDRARRDPERGVSVPRQLRMSAPPRSSSTA